MAYVYLTTCVLKPKLKIAKTQEFVEIMKYSVLIKDKISELKMQFNENNILKDMLGHGELDF